MECTFITSLSLTLFTHFGHRPINGHIFVILTASTLAIATASYLFMEKPILQFKDRVTGGY